MVRPKQNEMASQLFPMTNRYLDVTFASVTPVKASIQTRNGSHTPLRLHRTDAKSFRADVQKLMTDQPVEPHDV